MTLILPATLPMRRYACIAHGCGWQGLLRSPVQRPPGYLPQHWL